MIALQELTRINQPDEDKKHELILLDTDLGEHMGDEFTATGYVSNHRADAGETYLYAERFVVQVVQPIESGVFVQFPDPGFGALPLIAPLYVRVIGS